MSRTVFATALAGLMMVVGFAVAADDAKDNCLKSGDPIGPFYVTKVAGPEDGVENGKTLCYRCKYGARPMVMVFARETGGKVAELAKQLDQVVAKNEEAQLRGFFTLIGAETEALTQTAQKLAKTSSVKHVPITVAEDTENGPSAYKIDPKSEVTVVLAKDSKVTAMHTFSADQLDIAAVIKEVQTLVN